MKEEGTRGDKTNDRYTKKRLPITVFSWHVACLSYFLKSNHFSEDIMKWNTRASPSNIDISAPRGSRHGQIIRPGNGNKLLSASSYGLLAVVGLISMCRYFIKILQRYIWQKIYLLTSRWCWGWRNWWGTWSGRSRRSSIEKFLYSQSPYLLKMSEDLW